VAQGQEPTTGSIGTHRQLIGAAGVRHFGEHSERRTRQERHGIGHVLWCRQIARRLTLPFPGLRHQDEYCPHIRRVRNGIGDDIDYVRQQPPAASMLAVELPDRRNPGIGWPRHREQLAQFNEGEWCAGV